jgi:adenine deaminase
VIPGKIITDRLVSRHDAEGIAKLTVLERHGKGLKPSNAYVSGFGSGLKGAIASSVGHDSHNLIVAGSSNSDMQIALARLIECGGGFCVVQNGKVIADLPLPIGGLMSTMPAMEMVDRLRKLREASRTIGCELSEPFLQLAFLSLPVIPSLKLTDQGLVDVEKFSFIDVRAS